MSVKLVNQLKDSGWDKMDHLGNPFLSYEFFQTLEDSGSIGGSTGWKPVYITDPGKSSLYTFVKNHSYGEYIFDWQWANFYHQYNISYYPKLTSMIPFTSATTPHFLGRRCPDVMQAYEQYYEGNNFSSSHFLFLRPDEIDFFKSYDYLIRDSFQYHFVNNGYENFEQFLNEVKNKKAKQIRKERSFPEDISFKKISAEHLTQEHAKEMYDFYQTTIDNKGAISYLTKSFFLNIFDRLKNNICYIQASRNGKAIAGALYFFSNERLYGRYWGSKEKVANLHFELCYYQGIEFCIKKGFLVFEAGAQGEHKISRGFRPVKTYSAHKFKHPDFHQAIKKFIIQERDHIDVMMAELSLRLPFKRD